MHVENALPGHRGCNALEEAASKSSGYRIHALSTTPIGASPYACCQTAAPVRFSMDKAEQAGHAAQGAGLTAAISGTGSMTPWGKPGEEQTTSTVLAVRARLTEAGLSL